MRNKSTLRAGLIAMLVAAAGMFTYLGVANIALAATSTLAQADTTYKPAEIPNKPVEIQTTPQDTGPKFQPLTQLPMIGELANSNGLPTFLNALYKICIGLGAVLAVLMIMYAGFLFMTNKGSVMSNEKAKNTLQNALLGLLLILSPAIVFSIINPQILKLDFGGDFNKLQPDALVDSALLTCTVNVDSTQRSCLNGRSDSIQQAYNECIQNNPSSACASQAQGNFRDAMRVCKVDQSQNQNDCLQNQVLTWLKSDDANSQNGHPTAQQSCSLYDTKTFNQVPDGTSCAAGQEIVEPGCCQVGRANMKCCAAKASTAIIAAYSMVVDNGKGGTCRITPPPSKYNQVGKQDPNSATLSCDPDQVKQSAIATQTGGKKVVKFEWIKQCVSGPTTYAIPSQYAGTCKK